MALFTVESAAEMGRRSAALRKQREEQREQQRALILSNPPLPATVQTEHSQSKADRTRKQLDLVDQMIDQAEDADTLDALTRSKERLFRIWAHLAGIPSPGHLKPNPSRQQQRSATVEPIGPAPSTVHVQPEPKPNNP